MTLTALGARNEYTATAGQTLFNYTFKVYASSDLQVFVTPSGQDANDTNDEVTGFSVTGVEDEDGGTVTLASAASAGDLVTIVSNIPTSRTTDYQDNGDFVPDTVNSDIDRVVSLVKQATDQLVRTVLLQKSYQNAGALTLPIPEAGKIIRWNSIPDGFENIDLSELSPSTIVDQDLIKVFDSVASMVADTSLVVGKKVMTTGYYTAGDGGGNVYKIVAAATGTDDGGEFIDLVTYQAKGLFPGGYANVNQFGAKGDGTTDDTDEITAAIAFASGVLTFKNDYAVTTTIELKSGLELHIEAGASIIWDGSSGGTVIDAPTDSVLYYSGIICKGGVIDMQDAGIGLRLSSTQGCNFDLLFDGDSSTSTTVHAQGDATATTGSLDADPNTNIVSNNFKRIFHAGTCGWLLKLYGEQNASLGGVIALNDFGPMRGSYCKAGGILLSGYTDTNHFYGHINLRLEASSINGVVFDDDETVYENKFSHVSIGAYGAYTGRSGVYFGDRTRHNVLEKLFVDGDLDSENGNISYHADVQSYRVGLEFVGTTGVIIQELVKSDIRRATTYNGEDDKVTLTDDSATSFTLRYEQAVLVVSSGSTNATGLIWVKPKSTGAETKKLAGDATFFEVTTGALIGTTGTDARFTVSAHTDGKVYLENRLGATIYVTWAVLGAFDE